VECSLLYGAAISKSHNAQYDKSRPSPLRDQKLIKERMKEEHATHKLTGRDGQTVTIPDGGHGLQGSDGHMVAIPKGGHGLQGSDGRMVAIPAEGHGLQGSDGRMVAIPGKARRARCQRPNTSQIASSGGQNLRSGHILQGFSARCICFELCSVSGKRSCRPTCQLLCVISCNFTTPDYCSHALVWGFLCQA
jgi:hypothetical protein